jgi:hypothetical protein
MRLNVILSNECIVWLDQQALAIRRASGAAISRSELLRGIVGGLKDMDISFLRCKTEADVRNLLGSLLQTYAELIGAVPPKRRAPE